jgi:hypothetical protein
MRMPTLIRRRLIRERSDTTAGGVDSDATRRHATGVRKNIHK